MKEEKIGQPSMHRGFYVQQVKQTFDAQQGEVERFLYRADQSDRKGMYATPMFYRPTEGELIQAIDDMIAEHERKQHQG
jgi:hypothetical protein